MSEGLCTSCGAAVNLAAETEVKCDYCGTMVKPPEAEARFNEMMQSKVGGAFMLADTSLESGDFEAALNYYNKAIEADPTSAEAWFRKGFCVVRAWSMANPKATKEALSSWKNAIRFSKNTEAAKKRVATWINNSTVAGLKRFNEDFGVAFGDETPAIASQHEDFLMNIESFLSVALEYEPGSVEVAKNGIKLCDQAKVVCGEKYPAIRLRQASVKYEQALARLDSTYTAPTPPPTIASNSDYWKKTLIEPIRKLKPGFGVFLYPASSENADVEKTMVDFVTFLSPSETKEDVLIFERNIIRDCVLVTTKIIGWGVKGQPKKGFFSPAIEEKKVVISAQNLLDVVYAKPGVFDTKEPRPVIYYKNAFGVKESVVFPTSYFKMHQEGIGALPRHERAEAFVSFLKNWAGGRQK